MIASGASQANSQKIPFNGVSPELALCLIISLSFSAGMCLTVALPHWSSAPSIHLLFLATGCASLLASVFCGLRLITKLQLQRH